MPTRIHATLALALAAGLAAAPGLARADGQPVISLEITQLGRLPVQIYSDRASPVVSLPVKRTTGSGENVEIEYDTTAIPRPVTTLPVRRTTGGGENVDIEYDLEAGARMPHAVPNVGGGHNAALWNLQGLPPSIR
jgi:hypothetical protein